MLLTLENYGKKYGEKQLFRGVNLSMEEGDRIGIVGINGTGKSTFLRAVAGLVPIDEGESVRARGLRISYLAQDRAFPSEHTVLTEVFHGESPLMEALRGFELALGEAEDGNPSAKERLGKYADQIDALDGWQIESEAKSILTKLGLTDYRATIGSLSGGQQKRLALAAALVQPADLLLLDEPTNHLDSETIAWLEEYLRTRRGAILLVTHDRYFLDHAATKILELDCGSAYNYTGNYSEFLVQKDQRIEREAGAERKRQNFLRTELAWMRRGAQARSTKQQARIDRYEKAKAQEGPARREQLKIDLAGSRLGRSIIELENVSYAWGNEILVKDLSYTVLKRDRIAILGRNSVGKSTLLSIFAGELPPTSGSVRIGQTVKIGYLTQKLPPMDERLRAIEYIQENAHHITLADGTRLSASQLMERFLFPGDLQWRSVERLSGGERRRLFLLRILMEAPNILLLDEPTNDLDLDTLSVLEDFLTDFPGALIFVSHDRFFVDRLAEKTFACEGNGRIDILPGGYTDYRRRKAQEEEIAESRERKTSSSVKKLPDADEMKPKIKSATKRKFTFSEQKEYAEIEAVIASKEGELRVLEKQMEDLTDYEEIASIGREVERAQEELDKLMNRWAELEEISDNMTE